MVTGTGRSDLSGKPLTGKAAPMSDGRGLTEAPAEIGKRLQEAVENFESEMDDAHNQGERPDLWDQVVEIPLSDARAILTHFVSNASISQGMACEDFRIPERLIRHAYKHFQHDAEFPCSASAMREAIMLVIRALAQHGGA